MPCYFPLHAYKGKGKDPSKIVVVWKRSDSFRGERLDLPCGQCIGCRLERSRQWAVRCMHEASLYEKNSFLTLTYDEASRPADGSLKLDDFQLFMKRLRKSVAPERVRFFHCGEYGEALARPHYHALMFNYRPDDLRFFSRRGGNPLFTSAKLDGLWPFGFSVVGDVNFQSAAYVARYALKKITGDKAEAHYGGLKPEYTTMSRRPGIGKGWFDKFSADVFPRDGVIVRGVVTRPPRFYDSLLGARDPSTLALCKINRSNNERFVTDVYNGKTIVVSDSSDLRLAVKEVVKRAEIFTLKRDGV